MKTINKFLLSIVLIAAFGFVKAVPHPPKKLYTNAASVLSVNVEYSPDVKVYDMQITGKRNIKIDNISISGRVMADKKIKNYEVRLHAVRPGPAYINKVMVLYYDNSGETQQIPLINLFSMRATRKISIFLIIVPLLLLGAVILFFVIRRKRIMQIDMETVEKADPETDLEKFVIEGKFQKFYEYMYKTAIINLSEKFGLDGYAHTEEIYSELDKHGMIEAKNFLKELREIIFSGAFGDRFKMKYYKNRYLNLLSAAANDELEQRQSSASESEEPSN